MVDIISAMANITVSVSVGELAEIIIIAGLYLTIGILFLRKLSISFFSVGLCLFLWPLVIVFYGVCYGYIMIRSIPYLFNDDRCRCHDTGLATYKKDGEDILRCTRCGHAV
jgi:hypothetical protein